MIWDAIFSEADTGDTPVVIIAEAGVNHNGDIELAKRLVDVAKRAGADCIKFQTFRAETVVTSAAPKAHYQLKVTEHGESQFDMLKRLELSAADHRLLKTYCDRQGLEFFSTPYGLDDIALLEELDVAAYKVASGQIVEPEFLQAIGRTGKPIILSTGMATMSEVEEAVHTIKRTGNNRIALLQCTTNYPSASEDANLRAMPTMARACDTVMGYSDHTRSNTACIVAVGLGAKVIEKHLTLDKSLPGPDHSASADPEEFSCLVNYIREAEKTLGTGRKEPCLAEVENAKMMRRSIVAARAIMAGEVFSSEMLTCKRPGTGIKPSLSPDLIGRMVTQNIEADEIITWEMCGPRHE
jgi:N-acetylneuraminate synthase/N,N'-diacetyllegionaminate synthase